MSDMQQTRFFDLGDYCPGARVHVGDGIEAVIESATIARMANDRLFVNWIRVIWWADGIRQCQELSPWEVRPAHNGVIGFSESSA
jgi:hypothetical protein